MNTVPPTVQNVLAAVAGMDLGRPRFRRHVGLFARAAMVAAVSFGIAYAVDPRVAGILSISFAAAALVPTMDALLQENKVRIVAKHRSRTVNRDTAFSLLGVFLGILFAFGIISLLLGQEKVERVFWALVQVGQLNGESLLERDFPPIHALMGHNSLVLLSCVLIAGLYRVYGALLVLSWNAAIWATIITLMILRAQTPWTDSALMVAVMLPHVLLEATAYCLGCLASIFFSKGAMKYGVTDPRCRPILTASLWLLVFAVLAVVIGAVVEGGLLPALLARLN